MSAIEIILTVLQLLSGLAVTLIVLMQSGKSSGLSGVIAGGAETFMSKGKAKTLDAKLAKMTMQFAEAFFVLSNVFRVFRALSSDQFRACARSVNRRFTDVLDRKPKRNGNMLQVHADQGVSDVQTGVSFDKFHGNRIFHRGIDCRCK